MNALPITPPLLAVARRVVWFKKPEEALADPLHFLAHVMTYGAAEDLRALDGSVDADALREVLLDPPPGIFDGRSWAYWHYRLGLTPPGQPVPPLPQRRFD
ncbi:MAG: hypothetical protein P9F19_13330 [Candidatus Contendobacter sp.]|nr:hypothetical protein [Candidatus Contendobacter sp.]MDG4558352.1 hypothetical protein [Candidatus Contendobacter sp.]